MRPDQRAPVEDAIRRLYPREPSPSKRMPAGWRNGLPDPRTYYALYLPAMTVPGRRPWAAATCPFHDDKGQSLRVHFNGHHGGWNCKQGCGHGDMVTFHMLRFGLPRKAASLNLLQLAKKLAKGNECSDSKANGSSIGFGC